MTAIIIKFLNKWTDLCDYISGQRMDYAQSLIILFILIPFMAALMVCTVKYIWSKRSVRVLVGFMLIGATWPLVGLICAIYTIVEDKYPVITGTRRRLKKYNNRAVRIMRRYLL